MGDHIAPVLIETKNDAPRRTKNQTKDCRWGEEMEAISRGGSSKDNQGHLPMTITTAPTLDKGHAEVCLTLLCGY